MASASAKRVRRELKEMMESEEFSLLSIKVEPQEGEWQRLKGIIAGPSNTPYEGGKFEMDISVPIDYPFRPPVVRFETKIWHPNISPSTGMVCLDVLNSKDWTPAMTLGSILMSLHSLLASPLPDDPQDTIVAAQMKSDPEVFNMTARYWNAVYAKAPVMEDFKIEEDKVQRLKDQGVHEDVARLILSRCGWNEEMALQDLFP